MSMNSIKVTIGVPVYEVESYIERCCISLFSQTYDDIEYLFVDDCGKDNSIGLIYKVLDSYPQRKSQVSIIRHKRNLGLGAARNTIIENAKGDFITWVDSDDWVEPDMVDKCVKRQMINDADIVVFNYIIHHKHYKKVIKKEHFKTSKELSLAIIRRDVPTCVWSNFIRLSLYLDNNVRVEEGVNMGEDFQQMPRLTYYSNKIAYLDDVLYHYNYSNIDGYCNSGFSRNKWLQNNRSYSITQVFFEKLGNEYTDALKVMNAKYVSSQLIFLTRDKIHHEEYNEILKQISNLDRKSVKYLPWELQIVLYFRNRYLVSLYVRIGRFVKHFVQRIVK